MAERDAQGTGAPLSKGRLVIGVPKETIEGESRVALIPDTVRSLAAKGVDVVVETGAGAGSSIHDEEYTDAGATVLPNAAAVYERADLITKVQAPVIGDETGSLRSNQMILSFLAPLSNHDLVRDLAERGVTSLAMDAVPRITRAQSMDALSAMSTIGGYKAVLLAANHLPKFYPLLMTAAGTIAPAKVLVLGAGVAGLQAIATARRLGAVVEAYDVRPVVKEQVESLGAKFIEIDVGGADTQTAGGYAREMTPDELRRQQEALNEHITRFDVVITTALVPGRPAPKMVPESAVRNMRTGSVIVDLAAETGGNCELTEPGEIVKREGVTIIGLLNLPSLLPVHASQMYARVVQNFLNLLIQDGQANLNLDDEIIRGMCITRDGEVIQEQTRKLMGLDAPPQAPETTTPKAAEIPAPKDQASNVDVVDSGSTVDEDSESLVITPSESDAVETPAREATAGDEQAAIHGREAGPTGPLDEVVPVADEEGATVPDDDVEVRVEDEYREGPEEVRLEPLDEDDDAQRSENERS